MASGWWGAVEGLVTGGFLAVADVPFSLKVLGKLQLKFRNPKIKEKGVV